jgi:putative transcriptional regulator
LKKGKALGINFDTLERICQPLKCKPGDVLSLSNEKSDRNLRGRKNVSE